MRCPAVCCLRIRILFLGFVLVGYGAAAAAQSACLPPFTLPSTAQPAASVLLYAAALERAERAHIIITTVDINDNVMLALRQAAAEARCAQSLVSMTSESADSVVHETMGLAGLIFGGIATGIDAMRESLIRQLDGRVVSAKEIDAEAAAVETVQSGWKGLMTPTIVLVSYLRNTGRGSCARGVSDKERRAILADLHSRFGRELSEADARRSFPLLSAYSIQSCLKGTN
jgi:hypothetical protein